MTLKHLLKVANRCGKQTKPIHLFKMAHMESSIIDSIIRAIQC